MIHRAILEGKERTVIEYTYSSTMNFREFNCIATKNLQQCV